MEIMSSLPKNHMSMMRINQNHQRSQQMQPGMRGGAAAARQGSSLYKRRQMAQQTRMNGGGGNEYDQLYKRLSELENMVLTKQKMSGGGRTHHKQPLQQNQVDAATRRRMNARAYLESLQGGGRCKRCLRQRCICARQMTSPMNEFPYRYGPIRLAGGAAQDILDYLNGITGSDEYDEVEDSIIDGNVLTAHTLNFSPFEYMVGAEPGYAAVVGFFAIAFQNPQARAYLDTLNGTQKGKLFDSLVAIGSSYFKVPYHNERHGVGVCNMIGIILSDSQNIAGHEYEYFVGFSNFEVFGLLIAGIGHDAGHPGFSNSMASTMNIPAMTDKRDGGKLTYVLETYHGAVTTSRMLAGIAPVVTTGSEMEQNLETVENDAILQDWVERCIFGTYGAATGAYFGIFGQKTYQAIAQSGGDVVLKLAKLIIHCADVSMFARTLASTFVELARVIYEFMCEYDAYTLMIDAISTCGTAVIIGWSVKFPNSDYGWFELTTRGNPTDLRNSVPVKRTGGVAIAGSQKGFAEFVSMLYGNLRGLFANNKETLLLAPTAANIQGAIDLFTQAGQAQTTDQNKQGRLLKFLAEEVDVKMAKNATTPAQWSALLKAKA